MVSHWVESEKTVVAKERNRQTKAEDSSQLSQDNETGRVDVTFLLLQYGKAMARVGELEAKLQALANGTDPRGGQGVLEKDLEELKLRNAQLSEKESEVTILTAQIAALKAKLEDTTITLRLVEEGKVRKNRHCRHPWWHVWHFHRHRRTDTYASSSSQ